MNSDELLKVETDKINDRNKRISDAFEVLKQEIKADARPGSLAHAWHCNIAMSFYDECTNDISHDDAHKIGNRAASRFMKMCFDVKTA